MGANELWLLTRESRDISKRESDRVLVTLSFWGGVALRELALIWMVSGALSFPTMAVPWGRGKAHEAGR